MILALRDVQDVVQAVPVAAEATTGEGEIARVGLVAERVVDADRVIERVAQRAGHVVQRPALRVGHRHQFEALFQAGEGGDRVGEGRPVLDRADEGGADCLVRSEAEDRGHLSVDAQQVVGIAAGAVAGACGAVGGQDRVVVARDQRRAAGGAEEVEHAALEVDQRADDVEGEDFRRAAHAMASRTSGSASVWSSVAAVRSMMASMSASVQQSGGA